MITASAPPAVPVRPGIRSHSFAPPLTPRERWVRTMHFQRVDRVPHEEFGYWDETLPAWHTQGLPAWVVDEPTANRFFGFDRREGAGIHLGIMPAFSERVIEEDEQHKVIVDGLGVTCLVKKDGTSSIPKYLEFPVKNRADWEEFKKRLDPGNPMVRYPHDWEMRVQEWRHRDYPLGIGFGSLLGWPRDWMGFEHLAVAVYDDPVLVRDMVEHLTDFICTVIERALTEVQFDFASGWEDICFNNGPLVSPKMFQEFVVPGYQRITSLLRRHGIDIIYTDCDGNINDLVESWLDSGINTMFPIEVRAGSDPVELRKKYGERVLLLGGVDKMKLMGTKSEIDRELLRLEPLVDQGGFIPHVDHRCPPDVPYDNYLHYLRTKKKMLGFD